MKKTTAKLNEYLRLFEQDELDAEMGDQPEDAEPVEQAAPEPVDENVKYVIKLLTNSFIFDKTKFSQSTQQSVDNLISDIQNDVNQPVASIIGKVKRVLSLDSNLRVESIVVSTMDSYISLYENADATNMQSGTSEARGEPINAASISEIFPMYQKLIVSALQHTPTAEELSILDPVIEEFADTDPTKIKEAITQLLSQSGIDTEVESNLNSVETAE